MVDRKFDDLQRKNQRGDGHAVMHEAQRKFYRVHLRERWLETAIAP